jgi:ribosome-associated translation inhibitor RaiA
MSESKSISDSLLRKPIPKITTQSVSISDSIRNKISRQISDIITISEIQLRKVIPKLSTQTTNVSDALSRIAKHFRTSTDTTSVLDSLVRKIIRPISQSTTISDSMVRKIGRLLTQTTTISDSISRFAKHFKTLIETSAIAELLSFGKNKVSIVLTETINVADSIQRYIKRKISLQTVSISDSLLRTFKPFILEIVTISDSFARFPGNIFKIIMNIESVIIRESGFAAPSGPSWRWLFSPWRNVSFSNKFDPDREYPHIKSDTGPPPTPPDPVINAKEEEGRKGSFTDSFTPKKKGKGN